MALKLWKKYGISENHDYAVIGYRLRDGRPRIKVYNPSWEQHLPTAANRGGVLELSQEEFEAIFSGIFSVREPERRDGDPPPTS